MGADLILVLDEGTSSTRAVLYDPAGTVLGSVARPITQHYPAPGLVEHDAGEIWTQTLDCARELVGRAGGAERIAGIAITNQRETVVAWDRRTLMPLHRALVWQDRRTADQCARLAEAGHEARVRAATGLRLDPYFSATKMAWLAGQEALAEAAASGALAMGTVDSWLVAKLTGGEQVTEPTNASRTLLMDLEGRDWDPDLCELFGVDPAVLGRIGPSAGAIGHSLTEWFGAPLPIVAIVGDQQAATIGEGCLDRGDTKLTLGTGAFVLTALGERRPGDAGQLVATVLVEAEGRRQFGIEGSVFVAGSLVKWLRDGLGLIGTAADSETLARSVADNGGVVMVPALAGLGAPYWRPEARAAFSGMSFATTHAHLVRAALESVSHQMVDLATAFAGQGAAWATVRLDGGMAVNDWLAQDLADMLGLVIERPADVETTARGAAMLGALGAGLYPTLDDAVAAMASPVTRFAPAMDGRVREARLAAWREALAAAGVGEP